MAHAVDADDLVQSIPSVGPLTAPRPDQMIRRGTDLVDRSRPPRDSGRLSVGRGITLSGEVNSCERLPSMSCGRAGGTNRVRTVRSGNRETTASTAGSTRVNPWRMPRRGLGEQVLHVDAEMLATGCHFRWGSGPRRGTIWLMLIGNENEPVREMTLKEYVLKRLDPRGTGFTRPVTGSQD